MGLKPRWFVDEAEEYREDINSLSYTQAELIIFNY